MVGDSWTHKVARVCITPLIGSPVTPNHLTTLRLIVGIGAVLLFATGLRNLEILGGWLWLASAFLDRADGELARASGKISAAGHRFDYFCDSTVTSLFFVGIGFGLRNGSLGDSAIVMGLVAGGGVLVAEVLAERIDRVLSATNDKVYPGFAGFDFDDILYLFAPVVWLGWHQQLLVGATLGAPAFALLTYRRYRMTFAE